MRNEHLWDSVASIRGHHLLGTVSGLCNSRASKGRSSWLAEGRGGEEVVIVGWGSAGTAPAAVQWCTGVRSVRTALAR